MIEIFPKSKESLLDFYQEVVESEKYWKHWLKWTFICFSLEETQKWAKGLDPSTAWEVKADGSKWIVNKPHDCPRSKPKAERLNANEYWVKDGGRKSGLWQVYHHALVVVMACYIQMYLRISPGARIMYVCRIWKFIPTALCQLSRLDIDGWWLVVWFVFRLDAIYWKFQKTIIR